MKKKRLFFNFEFKKWIGLEHLTFIFYTILDCFNNIIYTFRNTKNVINKSNNNSSNYTINLSEQQLKSLEHKYFCIFLIFLFMGIILMLHFVYYATQFELVAAINTITISSCSLIFSLKYHFWLFQVRNKKFNCTLKEWMRGEVYGNKHR